MTKCDVIQDLIPLYHDEVASEGSCALVDEHIKECANCAELLEKYKDNSNAPTLSIENIEINALKKMKKRISKKIALITISAVLCTGILIWVVFTWRIPTPFNADNIVVHPIGSIQLPFRLSLPPNEGEEMNSSPILEIRNNYDSVTIMQIGDELFVNFRNTLYTRFIRQDGLGRWYGVGDEFIAMTLTRVAGFQDDNSMQFEIGEDVNKIYFMNANYNRLFRLASDDSAHDEARATLEKAKGNAILVWER